VLSVQAHSLPRRKSNGRREQTHPDVVLEAVKRRGRMKRKTDELKRYVTDIFDRLHSKPLQKTHVGTPGLRHKARQGLMMICSGVGLGECHDEAGCGGPFCQVRQNARQGKSLQLAT
jgi:hypothetical protein